MNPLQWIIEHWLWIVLVLFVADNIVKLTPWDWDDLVVTGIKKALTSFTGRKIAPVLLFGVLAMGVSACAVKTISDLPAHKQAQGYVDILMDTCVDIENAYNVEWAKADAAKRKWFGADVGTRINAARHAIALAANAAVAWGMTVEEGGDEGAAQAKYDALFHAARDALNEARELWASVNTDKE